MARRDYAGGAVETTITSGISPTSLTIDIASATGWPTGGANGKFFVTIDAGIAVEEKVLVASRTGTVLTIASTADRGVDDTSAAAHNANATIIHSISALDIDEANAHINDATTDTHTQYMKADGTRHDLTARHAAGSVVPTAAPIQLVHGVAAAEGSGITLARASHVHSLLTGTPGATGTVNAEGTSPGIPRLDHTHAIGSGSVDNTTLEVSGGIVGVKNLGITTGKLANDAVTADKLADGAIDASAKMAAGVVDQAAIGDNAVGTNEILNAALTMAKFASEAGTTYVPTLGAISLGTGGTSSGRYFKFGRMVVGQAQFELGTGGNVIGSPTISVPFTAAAVGADWFMAARAIDTATGTRATGVGLILSGGTFGGGFATIGTALWSATVPFDWQAGSQMWVFYAYEAAG